MRKTIFGVAALLLLAGSANATNIGYSKEEINRLWARSNSFRVGSTATQGQAIRLSKEKLQMLKGKTINCAEFVVASGQTTGKTLHAFITTSLGGTPIAEGDVSIDALKWVKFTLPTPYTITGNEENLYIGFTAEIETSYKMLLGDGSYDISGYNFAYQDGNWVDTYGLGHGSAYIRVNVDGAPDYTDAIIGKTNFDGYYKAGNNYDFTARFINAGTTAINDFDAIVCVDGKETTQHFSDVALKPKEGYSFKLSGVNSDTEGGKDISVKIANVNGAGAESDASDNETSGNVYFYPNNMERSILVEGFTGQDCTQCPKGHTEINSAIDLAEKAGINIVEVSHHAGFYPDMFTMQEDASYLFYYTDPTSTFAPAVMANRNADPSISSIAPVSEVSVANAAQLISHAEQGIPYVSLNLETSYNKDTRELKYKLGVKPHTTLPTNKILYNIFLVQDGIKGYQANGGADYTHNAVFRGTLTGNAWGVELSELTPGTAFTTKEVSYTLPESIHSSFYTDDMLTTVNGKEMYVYSGTTQTVQYEPSQLAIAAVPENMYLVAYVGEYDTEDKTKNVVFNCVQAKLGESYKQAAFDSTSGIETVEGSKSDADIYVSNGKVNVSGKCDKLYVYTLAGRQLDANSTLAKGIYVVKAVSGGKQTTKKILVR